jgi:hypothetical protein
LTSACLRSYANGSIENFEPEATWGSTTNHPKSRSTKLSGTSTPQKQASSAVRTSKLYSLYVGFERVESSCERHFRSGSETSQDLPPTILAPTRYDHLDMSGELRAKEFWRDTPWLAVPTHRTALIVEHPGPKGRLLGGAPKTKEGKVSKLAALAAKRRQAEAAKSSEESVNAGSGASDDYTETLNQLRISQSWKSVSTETKQEDELADNTDDVNVDDADKEPEEDIAVKAKEVVQDLRGTPSAFARTLAGANSSSGLYNLTIDQLGLSSPVLKFAEPSPDDVIAKAQKTRKS